MYMKLIDCNLWDIGDGGYDICPKPQSPITNPQFIKLYLTCNKI